MRRVLVVFLAGLLLAAAATAFAQEFPTRTVRMVVPLTPGSGADVVGRIVAKHMSASWKHPVVVENRPGAGGQIGTQAVVQSPPDGYTTMVQSASHAANSAIYKSLPYDPLKDLIDVAILGMTPYVMVASPTGPYKTLKALIDAAKAKPEAIPFASAGVGSSTHLTAEYFAQAAGITMLHIPYKGSPEAIRDSAAGLTAFYMAPINTAIGLIKDKKVAALGVTSAKRAAALPDVPTIAEQGVSGWSMTLWFGMWLPAGTPEPVTRKFNAEVNRVLQSAEVREQYTTLGVEPVTMQPAEFAKFVREEIGRYQQIVKQGKIEQQ
jgi:tripartite-type tricarboxylate transporter receptor subunit TctC